MIESVFKQGDDALLNMAELQFPVFRFFNMPEELKFRTTNISIPEFQVGSYEVHWKAQKFEKPSGKDETAKTMSFTFRIDKYYKVYKALQIWWQYICNPATGAMAEDVSPQSDTSDIRCDFQVRCVDTRGVTTTEGWRFSGAWLKSLAGIEFDENSGDPISIAVTMSYVKAVPQF